MLLKQHVTDDACAGASMLYSVSGQVAADQLSPYSQVVVSEPIVNSAAVASAVVPVDHDPEDPGDGQGLPQAPPAPQRGPGLPALLMYARVRKQMRMLRLMPRPLSTHRTDAVFPTPGRPPAVPAGEQRAAVHTSPACPTCCRAWPWKAPHDE